jgi:hypothetical protein
VILESGTVQVIGAAITDVDSEFVRVATAVGCVDTDRAKELECMRKVDAVRLKHAISNQTLNLFGSPAGGTPMVDNTTLFTIEEYSRRGQAGEFAKIASYLPSKPS